VSKQERFKDIWLGLTNSNSEIILFDLDGTLVNIDHRMHLYHQQDWDNFNKLCVDDSPIGTTISICNTISAGRRVEVWTARNEVARELTEQQLDNLGICYHQLQMRPTGDTRPDCELKRSWYLERKRVDPNFAIVAVFEDRQTVVDMWRSLGITCYQVAPGDF